MSAVKLAFFRMGLDEPHVNAWFGGMYGAYFDALARVGCQAALAGDSELQRADALVVPLGGGQDQAAARAMAAFGGPVVLYVPSAQVWFRSGFLDRWRHQILFAYGTDAAPATRRRYRDLGLVYHTMPFASDPSVMRPLDVGEVFDVVFVANARSGAGRHAYVEALLAELGRDRVLLVGPGWEGLGYPSQSVAWGPLLNAIYNLGRVCVNVHNLEQWSTPSLRLDANNRLFDLAMAERPQVCVASATAAEFFTRDEMAVADTPQEFVSEVDRLLADPKERRAMAVRARERAMRDHSWDPRARAFAGWLQSGSDERKTHDRARGVSALWRLRDTMLPPYGPREIAEKLARRAAQLGHSSGGGS